MKKEHKLLTWQKAVAAMKEGKVVTRESYMRQLYVFRLGSRLVTCHKKSRMSKNIDAIKKHTRQEFEVESKAELVAISEEGIMTHNWQPSSMDLFANDFYVINE